MPFHLLFPLFSSIVFVVGMLFAKNAISRGASPWTGTLLGNFWLAIVWIFAGLFHGELLPVAGWWQAVIVGCGFLLGQIFTYLAFQFGDVSVATPIFGVKVIIVAAMASTLAGERMTNGVWFGAFLATLGVVLVQAGTRSPSVTGPKTTINGRKAAMTVVMALLAAISLSLFDLGLLCWGRQWGAGRFLPVMFAATGLLSVGILPWVDRPSRLRELKVGRVMILGTLLMALQAVSMSYSLSVYGDVTRINIVYALRGLWAVLLAWMLARVFGGHEAHQSVRVMLLRVTGATLLTASVIVALAA